MPDYIGGDAYNQEFNQTDPTTPSNASNGGMDWLRGGIELATNVGNALLQNKSNKDNMGYQTQMYDKQRADALTDWQRNADYNSPTAIMARYKAAGLNPNLIYGNGTNAQAQMPRAASATSSNIAPMKIDSSKMGDILSQQIILNKQKPEIDNLKASSGLIEAQTQLTKYNSLKTLQEIPNVQANTNKTTTETSNLQSSFPVTLEKLKADLVKTIQDTLSARDSNTRENTKLQPTIDNLKASTFKTKVDTLVSAETIKKIQEDTTFIKLENELRKGGASFRDPLWQRQLSDAVDKIIGDKATWKAMDLNQRMSYIQKWIALPAGTMFKFFTP